MKLSLNDVFSFYARMEDKNERMLFLPEYYKKLQ